MPLRHPELFWQNTSSLQNHFNGGSDLELIQQFFAVALNGVETDVHFAGNLPGGHTVRKVMHDLLFAGSNADLTVVNFLKSGVWHKYFFKIQITSPLNRWRLNDPRVLSDGLCGHSKGIRRTFARTHDLLPFTKFIIIFESINT